ncbi:hypothetical protein BS47DRAFT_1416435 [Hydnum rufescens UP504]|uniref:Actin-like protein ARP6 n=1 Tax=Hydnum rufescens UP504 TaxID=1448309 RepID=A0A9P6B769_9AGAM|nr:hypothetical protein BS47DRAFT_1416435 [Hydnum rufescens UP504]
MNSTLILDNGASTLKAGFAHLDSPPRLVSNAIVKPKGGGAKLYIGHEIEDCRDFFGLYYRRPFERGILCDWDTEKAIWDTLFSPEGMNIDTRATSLLVTEPYFNLPAVQETYDQLVFEEYEFISYLRCHGSAAPLLQYGDLFEQGTLPAPECFLIVDSGFSFTHIVPVMRGVMVLAGIHRIDVGGKLLTNHLKEVVSFRHWDLMEHTYVMNEVKEACCYVSNTFGEDLEACQVNPRRNPIVQEYVLPDFSTRKRGYIRNGPGKTDPPNPPDDTNVDPDAPKNADDEPVLYMSNERFTVPEVLFHPIDVGLDQSGLAHTIANSISSLPEELQGMFWGNIGLVGGNFNIPGIVDRLRTELRALAPPEVEVSLYTSKDPITQTYLSARAFARTPAFASACITREEYLESGSNACRRKFGQNLRDGFEGARGELDVITDVDVDVGREDSTTGASRTRGKGSEKRLLGRE